MQDMKDAPTKHISTQNTQAFNGSRLDNTTIEVLLLVLLGRRYEGGNTLCLEEAGQHVARIVEDQLNVDVCSCLLDGLQVPRSSQVHANLRQNTMYNIRNIMHREVICLHLRKRQIQKRFHRKVMWDLSNAL
jgi:hypothetical protein